MADELDEEERALLKKHRDAKAAARQDDFEVEVGDGKGNYARVPYAKARNWLRGIGFEIDDEPEQDEPEAEPEPKRKPAGSGKQGTVTAFGRRIS